MRWVAFVDALLSPLGFGLALAAVLYFARRRLPRIALRVGLLVEAICLVLSMPIGANTLVAWQEGRVARPESCQASEPHTIVLLSGGMRRPGIDADDVGVLSESSLQRTLAAARLAHRVADADLVVSGGARYGRGVAQSLIMARLAEDLGVPASAIRTETAARTTWENATRVRALDPPPPPRIWLVTSAMHMPRALIAFRAAGFDPCAYPADFRAAPFDGIGALLPSAGAIGNSAAVLHELVGEIAYRMRAAFSARSASIASMRAERTASPIAAP
jgi:uncharacterized SAM-binding protein YcdF (DUF218 family)